VSLGRGRTVAPQAGQRCDKHMDAGSGSGGGSH
jgi:hypothetical protein